MTHLIFVWKQLQKDINHTDKILVNIANVIGGKLTHLIFVWKQLQKDLYHTDKILVNIHTLAAVIHHQSNLVCE